MTAATSGPPRLLHLKTRKEFLAAALAPSCARGGVVVQRRPRPERPGIGMGFTATKKIGGAVVRNRAKRRLREAARRLLPLHGEAGHDYVFIARAGAVSRPWNRLLDDVENALLTLAAGRGDPPRPPRAPPRRPRATAPSPQPLAR